MAETSSTPLRSVISLGLAVVVSVAVGQMPDGRLALDVDVLLVVIDVEARLGRVAHSPDDDDGDLDGIAAFVVDLELLAAEVPHAERNPQLGVQRIGPMPAAVPDRASIGPEEDQHAAFVRLQGEVAEAREEPQARHEHAAAEQVEVGQLLRGPVARSHRETEAHHQRNRQRRTPPPSTGAPPSR